MDTPNIIASAVLIFAIAIIIVTRVIIRVKNNGGKCDITIEEFIETYSDQIIAVLKDAIVILQINIKDFASKEDYEKTIISVSIEKLKENTNELGIDCAILKVFDSTVLAEIIYEVMNGNLVEVFSVLGKAEITENVEMYDPIVVESVG